MRVMPGTLWLKVKVDYLLYPTRVGDLIMSLVSVALPGLTEVWLLCTLPTTQTLSVVLNTTARGVTK